MNGLNFARQDLGDGGQWELEPPFATITVAEAETEFAFRGVKSAAILGGLKPIVRFVGRPVGSRPILGNDLTTNSAQFVVDCERIVGRDCHWCVQRFECPTPPSSKATNVEQKLIFQRDEA